MIKIGDTFKAGDEVWTVDRFLYERNNAIYLRQFSMEIRYGFIEILVDAFLDVAQKQNKYKELYAMSVNEMRMCIEIIDKLKGEVK